MRAKQSLSPRRCRTRCTFLRCSERTHYGYELLYTVCLELLPVYWKYLNIVPKRTKKFVTKKKPVTLFFAVKSVTPYLPSVFVNFQRLSINIPSCTPIANTVVKLPKLADDLISSIRDGSSI